MSEETEKKEAKLGGKMKKFADFWLGETLFNGTKSARLAGYDGNNNTLAATASRLLRNVKVAAYVEEQLATGAMGINETITRLAEIARGNVEELLDENGNFSIEVARQRNKTHLLKKIKTKRTIRQKKTEISDPIVEIIYDAALRDIGKIHKLFTDKTEITGKDGKDFMPKKFILERVNKPEDVDQEDPI
jgi:phage terminase small subunit